MDVQTGRNRFTINRYLKTFLAHVLSGVCMAGALQSISVVSGEEMSKEYKIKAGFFFNFAKFVTWPDSAFASPEATLSYCVCGENPFGPLLDAFAERRVQGRKVSVRTIDSLDDLALCRLLYIPASEDGRVSQFMKQAEKSATLVVNEGAGNAMIRIVQDDGRIRFRINLDRAENAGLRLSSELLKLSIRD